MNDNQLPKPSIPNQNNSSQANNQQGQAASNNNAQANAAKQQGQQQNTNPNQSSELPPPSAMRTDRSAQQQGQPQGQPQQAQQPQGQPPQQAAQSQPPAQQQQSQLNTPMPPTSLSALSSMTSTNLPQGGNETAKQEQQPQQTRTGDIRAQSSVPQSPQTPQKTQNQGNNQNQNKKNETPATNNPKFAKAKKPFLKYLPFIGIGLVVLVAIGFAATRFLGGSDTTGSVNQDPGTGAGTSGGRTAVPAEQTTIEYWGLWEPEGVMESVIADFEDENPGISVTYVKQSHQDYRQRLQTAIASGNGPDLFRYHATWVPMLQDDLAAIPSSVISTAQFRQDYYPVAAEQLQHEGQIVGIPAMYDGLALLYNEEIFTAAGEDPPQTWADLRTVANKLTVKSGSEITRAGIALGTATNVDHFSDILAVLMLQNGADLSQPNSAFTRDALLFYTNFATADEVWNERLPNSTVAFARGDAAMIFAPSWRIHEIIAMNSELDIGVAPLPLLGNEKTAWASYWAEGMSARSTKKDAAAKFLQHLTSEEVLQQFYSTASENRAFGELYPKPGMANLLADDEYVSPYLQDAPDAEGWYLSSATHDNGINDQLIKYYEDAVTAIISGEKSADDVLSTLEQGTRQVLRQYNVTTQSN